MSGRKVGFDVAVGEKAAREYMMCDGSRQAEAEMWFCCFYRCAHERKHVRIYLRRSDRVCDYARSVRPVLPMFVVVLLLLLLSVAL